LQPIQLIKGDTTNLQTIKK